MCSGQRIDEIVIQSSAPTIAALRRVPVIAELARTLHVTTRPEIVRRFLLLKPGDTCTEIRRSESERILRAQPFIADASIVAFDNTQGGIDLEVRTSDEASVVIAGRTRSAFPPIGGITLGSSNVDGSGIHFAGSWRDGEAYRDGYGVRFEHPQLFRRPYSLMVDARRHPLGEAWLAEAAHPFLTDLQRIAWRARSGSSIEYVHFPTETKVDRALRLDRRFFDVGGMIRIGPVGRLSLFGASFSGDDERPGMDPVLITETGLEPDTAETLRNRYDWYRVARINLLWGVRDIQFRQVQGFDALTGTQDMPVGFQLGTMFGRSLSVLGSQDDDIFMATELYGAFGGQYSAFRFQGHAEGRRSNDTEEWDGILTSGRVAEYVRLTPHQTLIASMEWSAGWKQRIPYSFTLGESDGGLRGHDGSREPGAARLVSRLETRRVIPTRLAVADVGVALFGEAGQLWAGDVPFGVNTPLRGSGGFSILAAVPKRSARLWRMDVAFPYRPEPGLPWVQVRFSSRNDTRFFFTQPADVERTRERTVPSSVFRWP